MLETLKFRDHWMTLRRGVSIDTPHVSSFRWLWCRSRGGELLTCCLDRPGVVPPVEAVADSILVA
jgi:hypothetical protein